KGAPETRPSDRVRETVLNKALKTSPPSLNWAKPKNHPQMHGHAQFPPAGNWHLYTASLLMRFDLSPQRIALASAAALLSIVGLAYWLNILPPLGGYDKFGFLFPREPEQAPISSSPPLLPAVSSGDNGVGRSGAGPHLVRLRPADNARD